MITTSSPSYHNVFCPTAGTYSSYYFDALRANSRRSNKKVSLVKNTLSRAQLQQQERQQQQHHQKSIVEKNQHLPSLSKKMNSKKKSVRFSDKIDQVRLFYQWETPQQADQLSDNVPHFHYEQQQKHQVTPERTMVSTTAKLVLINNKEEQEGVTALKKAHQLLPIQVPLKLNSVHIVHNLQGKNSSSVPTIVGTCHVANLAFEKNVMVRYTFDNWSTFTDINAIYCESMAGSTIDRFNFEFKWENGYFDSSLQFALRYSVNDTEFWDNNNGNNYCA
ncbi:putative phosphatase regulatory subunit-domain-containing protein, partial [Circinella umbellata]